MITDNDITLLSKILEANLKTQVKQIVNGDNRYIHYSIEDLIHDIDINRRSFRLLNELHIMFREMSIPITTFARNNYQFNIKMHEYVIAQCKFQLISKPYITMVVHMYVNDYTPVRVLSFKKFCNLYFPDFNLSKALFQIR